MFRPRFEPKPSEHEAVHEINRYVGSTSLCRTRRVGEVSVSSDYVLTNVTNFDKYESFRRLLLIGL
jgi:hypothetical protein